MPDKPPAPRIPVAAAPAAVLLLLCTLLYAVVAALADAPWGPRRRRAPRWFIDWQTF